MAKNETGHAARVSQKPGTPKRSGETYSKSSSPVRSEADTADRSAAFRELLNAAARRPLAQAAST